MDFEFGLVGNDLDLSEDENLSAHLPEKAIEMELRRQNDLNFINWEADSAQEFQGFLSLLISELQPREFDYDVRINILMRLSEALWYMDQFKGAYLSPFGSFESNFYTRWADLDLSLQLPDKNPISKAVKQRVLKSFLRAVNMRGAEARNVQFIPHARVPLLTFEDSHYSISCDISVDNGVAVLKSRLLRMVGDIDPRCRDLIFLVKCWAKAHGINDPKAGTLNSFALCLLVVFHLQTRSPPVLPPLKLLLDEDIAKQLSDPENTTEKVICGCLEKVMPFIHGKYGSQNKSSMAELFTTFFNQFSAVKDLWSEGLTVCTYTGKWGDKTSTCAKWRNKRYAMAIEDPFDRAENCARSVQDSTAAMVFAAFESTADMLYKPVLDYGLSSVLDVLFHWPVSTQNLGLSYWLSRVHSKEMKLNAMIIRKTTEKKTAEKKPKVLCAKTRRRLKQFETRSQVTLDTVLAQNLGAEFAGKLQTGEVKDGRKKLLPVTKAFDSDVPPSVTPRKPRRRKNKGLVNGVEGESNGPVQPCVNTLSNVPSNQRGDSAVPEVIKPDTQRAQQNQNTRWGNKKKSLIMLDGKAESQNEIETLLPGGEIVKLKQPTVSVNTIHLNQKVSKRQTNNHLSERKQTGDPSNVRSNNEGDSAIPEVIEPEMQRTQWSRNAWLGYNKNSLMMDEGKPDQYSNLAGFPNLVENGRESSVKQKASENQANNHLSERNQSGDVIIRNKSSDKKEPRPWKELFNDEGTMKGDPNSRKGFMVLKRSQKGARQEEPSVGKYWAPKKAEQEK